MRLQPATSKPMICELAGRILPQHAEAHDADPHLACDRRGAVASQRLALLIVVEAALVAQSA